MLCVLPLFSGQLNLFLFPQYFSFSLFFCLFLFLNTDDIQINDRSIAGGSPKGHDWECWGQKFLMHLMGGGHETEDVSPGYLWPGQSGWQCSY